MTRAQWELNGKVNRNPNDKKSSFLIASLDLATEVVQAARGRLKGALRDVISGNDEEDEEITPSIPSRGRPPKKAKKDFQLPLPLPIHQSFIMKLFERSVDLAKYKESTSLYPICRAWMLNQPRSNAIINFKTRTVDDPVAREAMPNLLEDFKSGAIIEVGELPTPEDVEVSRIPSPLPFQSESSKDKIDLDYVSLLRRQTVVCRANEFPRTGFGRAEVRPGGPASRSQGSLRSGEAKVERPVKGVRREEVRTEYGDLGRAV